MARQQAQQLTYFDQYYAIKGAELNRKGIERYQLKKTLDDIDGLMWCAKCRQAFEFGKMSARHRRIFGHELQPKSREQIRRLKSQ